jgi:vitamin K-dependent gamma-carboxylase
MVQSKVTKFLNWLREPMDGRIFRVFRVLFGLCMVYEMLDYIKIDLIGQGFLKPKVHFTYDYFEWVHPLSAGAMHFMLGVMLICAVLLTVGIFLKWSCRLFALLYAYFFFIDKAYYNNHLYLFLLLLVLLSFSADNFTFGKNGGSKFSQPVARWTVFIVQMQVLIVYFYGGLAKLNADWLFRQEPVRSMASSHGGEWLVYLLTFGGLAIDLLAPLMLFFPKYRKWAIWGYVGFHLLNSWIFSDIGVFPFVMLAGLLLFYAPTELGWFNGLFGKNVEPISSKKGKNLPKTELPTVLPLRNWTIGFLGLYFLIQIFFPLRGFFLPNPMDYTTIGNRFSWRMKIDTRLPSEMKFRVRDLASGQEVTAPITQILNEMQIGHLATDPRSVVQMAQFLKTFAKKQGMTEAEVFAKIKFGYNGRPASDFLNPETNLAAERVNILKKIDWLVLPPE